MTKSLFPSPVNLRRVHATQREAAEVEVDDQRFHRIAVSRLSDPLYLLERHWRRKYRCPPRPMEDYTLEELYVEYLEDHYAVHPEEANALRDEMQREEPLVVHGTGGAAEWDGQLPPDLEQQRQEFWRRRQERNPHLKVDLERFRSDEVMTPERAAEIMKNVGRVGAPPVASPTAPLPPDEFDEEF